MSDSEETIKYLDERIRHTEERLSDVDGQLEVLEEQKSGIESILKDLLKRRGRMEADK